MKDLTQFIKGLQTDKNFRLLDEASVKLAIILKVLSYLGWDPFDFNEIQSEYNTNKQKIDFVLKKNDSLEVFLIVNKDFSNFESHIETLLYSSEMYAVKIAIYTNGFSWWFFLPIIEGSIDDKRFLAIDTGKDKAELIARGLYDFISKENVISGKAIKLAEEICNKRKQASLIKENLLKAWEKVINEPEKYLVDIISEVTTELCGNEPKREKVVEFIKVQGKIRSRKSEIYEVEDLTKINDDKSKKSYVGKDIKSFKYNGDKCNVKSWGELPWELCKCIIKSHKESFENVLYISLNGRDFFSNNSHQFILNKEIPGTGIYVNTDLSEVLAVALSNEILNFFGYNENDLVINTN